MEITRNPTHQGALTFEQAISSEFSDAIVCGGAEIYELFAPYISEFVISRINYTGAGDTLFPEHILRGDLRLADVQYVMQDSLISIERWSR